MITQIQRILTIASGEGIRKVLTGLTAQGVVLHNARPIQEDARLPLSGASGA